MFFDIFKGASTSVWAAVASELENIGGKYLEDCHIANETTIEELQKTYQGYLPYALDEQNALKLWNISKEIINQSKLF